MASRVRKISTAPPETRLSSSGDNSGVGFCAASFGLFSSLMSLYSTCPTQQAERPCFDDPSVFLEKATLGRIEAYGSARGWALFQYPKDTGTRFEPAIKVTITDCNNTIFTTPALKPVAERISQPVSTVYSHPGRFEPLSYPICRRIWSEKKHPN
jgi:hypothetical protein